MLIKNLWAKRTMQAMLAANGRLVMFERIPHVVVEEALADIAALATGAGVRITFRLRSPLGRMPESIETIGGLYSWFVHF